MAQAREDGSSNSELGGGRSWGGEGSGPFIQIFTECPKVLFFSPFKPLSLALQSYPLTKLTHCIFIFLIVCFYDSLT